MTPIGEMRGFIINVDVGSPMAIGALPYGPTLDSVLLGLLSGGRACTGAAESELLERFGQLVKVVDGIPAATALIPTSSALHFITDEHPRNLSAKDVTHWAKRVRYNTESGEYVGRMHQVRAVMCSRWEWWGVGDIEGITDVLGALQAVGGRRGSGYGVVDRWSIREATDEWQVVGISNPILSRPVPLDLVERFLEPTGCTSDDLDYDSHAVVPLPRWPLPSWGGDDNPVATMVPVFCRPETIRVSA